MVNFKKWKFFRWKQTKRQSIFLKFLQFCLRFDNSSLAEVAAENGDIWGVIQFKVGYYYLLTLNESKLSLKHQMFIFYSVLHETYPFWKSRKNLFSWCFVFPKMNKNNNNNDNNDKNNNNDNDDNNNKNNKHETCW